MCLFLIKEMWNLFHLCEFTLFRILVSETGVMPPLWLLIICWVCKQVWHGTVVIGVNTLGGISVQCSLQIGPTSCLFLIYHNCHNKNKCKKRFVILQSIGIIAIKSSGARAVIYLNLQIFQWTFLIPIVQLVDRDLKCSLEYLQV